MNNQNTHIPIQKSRKERQDRSFVWSYMEKNGCMVICHVPGCTKIFSANTSTANLGYHLTCAHQIYGRPDQGPSLIPLIKSLNSDPVREREISKLQKIPEQKIQDSKIPEQKLCEEKKECPSEIFKEDPIFSTQNENSTENTMFDSDTNNKVPDILKMSYIPRIIETDKVTNALIDFLEQNALPYALCETPQFVTFIDLVSRGEYEVPSREEVKKWLIIRKNNRKFYNGSMKMNNSTKIAEDIQNSYMNFLKQNLNQNNNL